MSMGIFMAVYCVPRIKYIFHLYSKAVAKCVWIARCVLIGADTFNVKEGAAMLTVSTIGCPSFEVDVFDSAE